MPPQDYDWLRSFLTPASAPDSGDWSPRDTMSGMDPKREQAEKGLRAVQEFASKMDNKTLADTVLSYVVGAPVGLAEGVAANAPAMKDTARTVIKETVKQASGGRIKPPPAPSPEPPLDLASQVDKLLGTDVKSGGGYGLGKATGFLPTTATRAGAKALEAARKLPETTAAAYQQAKEEQAKREEAGEGYSVPSALWSGLGSIPGETASIVYGLAKTPIELVQQGAQTGEFSALEDLPAAIATEVPASYARLAADPLAAGAERPVETALNVLGVGQGLRTARKVAAATPIGAAAEQAAAKARTLYEAKKAANIQKAADALSKGKARTWLDEVKGLIPTQPTYVDVRQKVGKRLRSEIAKPTVQPTIDAPTRAANLLEQSSAAKATSLGLDVLKSAAKGAVYGPAGVPVAVVRQLADRVARNTLPGAAGSRWMWLDRSKVLPSAFNQAEAQQTAKALADEMEITDALKRIAKDDKLTGGRSSAVVREFLHSVRNAQTERVFKMQPGSIQGAADIYVYDDTARRFDLKPELRAELVQRSQAGDETARVALVQHDADIAMANDLGRPFIEQAADLTNEMDNLGLIDKETAYKLWWPNIYDLSKSEYRKAQKAIGKAKLPGSVKRARKDLAGAPEGSNIMVTGLRDVPLRTRESQFGMSPSLRKEAMVGLAKARHDAATFRSYRDLSDAIQGGDRSVGLTREAFEELKAASPEGARAYVEVPASNIPGTEVKQYGDLAGKFLNEDIFHVLHNEKLAQEAAQSAWNKGLNVVKGNLVVRNPGSMGRNLMSNALAMGPMSGLYPHDVAHYGRAVRQLASGNKGKLFREAQAAGVFDGLYRPSETVTRNARSFGGLFETVADPWKFVSKFDDEVRKTSFPKAKRTGSELGRIKDTVVGATLRGQEKLYDASDAVFRLALFDKVTSRAAKGRDTGHFFSTLPDALRAELRTGSPSPAALEEMRRAAGKYARQSFTDYEELQGFGLIARMPRAVEGRNVVTTTVGNALVFGSPFISYATRATPLYVRAAERNPWAARFSAILSDYYTDMSGLEAGYSEEDVGKIRRQMRKEGRELTGFNEAGDPGSLDVNFLVPFGSFTPKGEASDSLVDVVQKSLRAGLTQGNPAIAPALEFMYNQDSFTQKPIYQPGDSPAGKAQDLVKHLISSYLPFIPGSYVVPTPSPSDIVDAVRGTETPEAERYVGSTPYEKFRQAKDTGNLPGFAARYLGGAKSEDMPVGRTLLRKVYDARKTVEDLERKYAAKLRAANVTGESLAEQTDLATMRAISQGGALKRFLTDIGPFLAKAPMDAEVLAEDLREALTFDDADPEKAPRIKRSLGLLIRVLRGDAEEPEGLVTGSALKDVMDLLNKRGQ